MAASDSLFDSMGIGIKLSNEDIAELEGLREVAMATTFWLSMGYIFIFLSPKRQQLTVSIN